MFAMPGGGGEEEVEVLVASAVERGTRSISL